MKKFFENRFNNPFERKDSEERSGEIMNDNEQEITEEQTAAEETAEISENTAAAAENEPAGKTELEKLQEKYDTLNNQYLRLAADFDNYRKRQAQEREALISFGAQECLKRILEVSDNFDRAVEMTDKIDNIDKMKENFHVLHKQLEDSLSKMGLERIKCAGEAFDPNLHEAVMQQPSDEYPEGTVIQELQKGYKYLGKVLRPAMVSAAVKKE